MLSLHRSFVPSPAQRALTRSPHILRFCYICENANEIKRGKKKKSKSPFTEASAVPLQLRGSQEHKTYNTGHGYFAQLHGRKTSSGQAPARHLRIHQGLHFCTSSQHAGVLEWLSAFFPLFFFFFFYYKNVLGGLFCFYIIAAFYNKN